MLLRRVAVRETHLTTCFCYRLLTRQVFRNVIVYAARLGGVPAFCAIFLSIRRSGISHMIATTT